MVTQLFTDSLNASIIYKCKQTDYGLYGAIQMLLLLLFIINNKHNCAFHLCLPTLVSVNTLQHDPIWFGISQKSDLHSTVEYCISSATRASSLFSVTKSTSRLNFLRKASSCNFASSLTFFTSYQQTATQHINIISANQKAEADPEAVSRQVTVINPVVRRQCFQPLAQITR